MEHALTIDVEDWFQVLNMRGVVARERWETTALRCGDATRRILEVLERRQARATFFFLGWIAERLPELVGEVVAAGHEVASHGYAHELLDELGPGGFAEDLRRTERVLQQAGAPRPTAFRACTWSVTARTAWALPALAAAGYVADSSIFPIRHPDYGVPGAPIEPYRLAVGEHELLEMPPLVWEVMGRRVPVGGGGYLRLLPLALLERGLRQQEARGFPGCVYLHPWEVDPGQPRQPLGGLRGFRHYVNLGRTLGKLERLLRRFPFTTLSDALRALDRSRLRRLTPKDLWGR